MVTLFLRWRASRRATCRFLVFATVMFALRAHAAIVVDGVLDEPEWQRTDVQTCKEWKRTDPYTLDEPRYHNDVRIVSTDTGLAVAFTLDQPPEAGRVKPRTARNAESLIGDSVGFMVDFDGTGQTGYEFSVGLGGGVRDGIITNQNQFDYDWDGQWQHAVRETATQWIVEILIPWTTVNMRNADEPHHTIGVFFNRYVFDRRERYSCPGISYDNSALLADFRHIEIERPASRAQFNVVPYVTAIEDLITHSTSVKAGGELFWKPSSDLQLAATFNPDFGQVESDELVVNFSAIETIYTDKRPFFTENQALFDLRTPSNGELIYTRRVGGPSDDGVSGSSDINAALKVTGNAGAIAYGAFAAQESGYQSGDGRLFAAARVAWPTQFGRFGYISTYTEHPYLDRRAAVNGFDFDIAKSASSRTSGQIVRSDITTAGDGSSGWLAWIEQDFNRSAPLSVALKALYIDRVFDMNDLGYLERNSLRQVEVDTNYRHAPTNLAVSGESDRLYLQYRENDLGELLPSRAQVARKVTYSSGWAWQLDARYASSGVDDLISRGNGDVKLPARDGSYGRINTRRFGRWQYSVGGYVFQQGVEGYSGWIDFGVNWYAHEKLTISAELAPQRDDDWLLWQHDNLFGSYSANRLDYLLQLDWLPAARHELRLKWQWIGIDARAQHAYRTNAAGDLKHSDDALDDFSVNNLGIQLRYRYSFNDLSDLYVVYSRGGYVQRTPDDRSVGDLFGAMSDVRDAEQFLIKFSYRL
jgi:Domain of unknown function (DUF5916)